MPPASFLHSDIIDFIAECFKAIAREYDLDIKIKRDVVVCSVLIALLRFVTFK